ncbi:MAG: hypothetical protein QOF25_4781, partial [Mycobacterium sp.]|nr:hypothetical protein [Mycobacterium sp.]
PKAQRLVLAVALRGVMPLRSAKSILALVVVVAMATMLTSCTSHPREAASQPPGVNADGQMLDRAQELATTEPLPMTFAASDQVVDIAGDTAVIHGINTLTQDGKVLDRQRFTDVFVLQNGVWMALSAHETKL